jgi:hypothetical protein
MNLIVGFFFAIFFFAAMASRPCGVATRNFGETASRVISVLFASRKTRIRTPLNLAVWHCVSRTVGLLQPLATKPGRNYFPPLR